MKLREESFVEDGLEQDDGLLEPEKNIEDKQIK